MYGKRESRPDTGIRDELYQTGQCHTESYLFANGTPPQASLQFTAQTIVVDNYSSLYVYVPAAQRFAAPQTSNQVFPVYSIGQREVRFQAPLGIVQAADNGSPVIVTWFERSFEPSGGAGGPGGRLIGPDGNPLLPSAAPMEDGSPNPTTAPFDARGMAFNGSTWDRVYNNTQGTLLASAARTATAFSPTMTNVNARGVKVSLQITGASGTGGLLLRIAGKDSNGGQWNETVAPALVTATGVYVYEMYPGAGAAHADVIQSTSAPLGRLWYVSVTAGDATSYTYSVQYSYIV